MKVLFEKQYLEDLYTKANGGKKHRFQPQIVRKYIQIVDLMIELPNVESLLQYKSLHYERLHGDKEGISSLRINDQYRIEFIEILAEGTIKASICNIIDLSNHYQ